MPNPIERLFRAVILYTGLWWSVIGLWGIPASCVFWNMWNSQGYLQSNELFFVVVLLLVCGSRLIVGVICVCKFRNLADRQYRQIPGIAEMPEPKWHDTPVFATLLSTGTGLYCLDLCFRTLCDCINPLTMIGMANGDMTGIPVLDVWYYYWQTLLVPIISAGCAIVLLTQGGKIAARVTQMIETTPLPEDDLSDDMPPKQGGNDEPSD